MTYIYRKICKLTWGGFLGCVLAIGSVTAEDKIRVGQTDSIEFDKLYEAILTEAGINFEMVVVPTARKRRMFADGKILIDCCTAIEWRKRPKEIAVQLHSKPFFHSAEHYFFKTGSNVEIASHQDLKQYRLAIVRGFTYRNEESFGAVLKTTNIDEMMILVALGRAHVGLINPYDFNRRLASNPRPLRLGGQHEASPLRIRVHNSRADLLPRINAVIETFLSDGTIEKLQGRLDTLRP